VKQVFKLQCAIVAFALVFGAFSFVLGQALSATPDPFVTQLTSSPAGFQSFAGDMSLNARFVVFESNGDLSTEKTLTRNNADGNREIFIIDYAQRRIFQITDTKNVQNPPPSPTPTPTPTPTPSPLPSPTPTPVPTPPDLSRVKVEISNNRPMISYEGVVNGSGQRVYRIIFSSNAPDPRNFDGTETAALLADANQEIWIYEMPAVADVDLTTGTEQPFTDLAAGTLLPQITNTPASRAPTAGSLIALPFVADDNRDAAISDDGAIIAFISTRDLVPASPGPPAIPGNADGNPELFLRNVGTSAGPFVQATNTQDEIVGATLRSRFQQNPSLSGNGGRVAFISSANLTTAVTNNDDGGSGLGKGNAEVFIGTFSGSALTDVVQVTRTKAIAGETVNLLSTGRHLSRDGAFIALESLADDPKANVTATHGSFAVYVYNVAADTFAQASPRTAESDDFGFIHFPTFTDYNSTLTPGTLLFVSALNFKADGTIVPDSDPATNGINPLNQPQIFATPIPVTSTRTFSRLTSSPVGFFGAIRPIGSNTVRRIAFSVGGSEFGGGNPDNSTEVFYLLTPPVTPPESAAPLSFFAWPSTFPVAAATPAPSPVPSPTPLPSPGTIALGLAAGEFSMIRSTVGLANSDPPQVASASETARTPILPVELAGVSVSVNGAAAGLYFVGNTAKQIDFVMPPGLSPGLGTVVINNNGQVFRGFVQVVAAQPDIFTSTHDAGGRAVVCNVTNAAVSGCVMEPFRVMSLDGSGTSVATVLEVHLTGVRNVLPAETKVFIGTTEIIPTSVRRNLANYGFDIITFTLPSTLVPGDYPFIITVTRAGSTFSSRSADTAPRIEIIGP